MQINEKESLPHLLYAHNISLSDFADRDYAALYCKRRRDSNFAAAIKVDDKVHALRDHLGIAPLYFRFLDGTVRFSNQLSDLVQPSDTLSTAGVHALVKLGTPRLLPLFDEIHIVPPATVIEIDPERRGFKAIYSYSLKPQKVSILRSWRELVDQFEILMTRAIEQCVQNDEVALYLSGGIDSAMIGIILKKLGVKVRAYTSGPWGESSSDLVYARQNAEVIGVDSHEIHCLQTDDYESAMSALPSAYGIPHGTATALGVIKLRERTSVCDQRQIFFGQNSDTVMGAMTGQYLSYLLHPLPIPIRKRLHPALAHKTASEDYVHLARNYQENLAELDIPKMPSGFSKLHKVTATGMYIAQTPHDSEVYTQPSFICGQNIVSPCHNMDVVEFCMGLPLIKRLALDGKKLPILEKHLIQKLAIRHLPREIVYRKKAFVVSFERDDQSKTIYDNLPREIFGVTLSQPHERFGAEMLLRWLEHCGLSTPA